MWRISNPKNWIWGLWGGCGHEEGEKCFIDLEFYQSFWGLDDFLVVLHILIALGIMNPYILRDNDDSGASWQ